MIAREERVALLEGQVGEQGHMIESIREGLFSLDRRMDQLERRMDQRFEAIDRRFEAVDRRLDGLDGKMSRQFMWLVGMHVTTLVAIIAALLAR